MLIALSGCGVLGIGSSSSLLEDTSWRLEAAVGTSAEPGDDETYTIDFDEDGWFGARIDCNGGGGRYREFDHVIGLRPHDHSLADCGAPFSEIYWRLLASADHFTLQGDVFTLYLEDGGVLRYRRRTPERP